MSYPIPRATASPLPKRRRAKAAFTESTPFITELHFHLHTDYFKELDKWRGGERRDRCPSEARTPSGLPQARAGREHQAVSLWAPALHVHAHSKPAAPHT